MSSGIGLGWAFAVASVAIKALAAINANLVDAILFLPDGSRAHHDLTNYAIASNYSLRKS
jgi:hypothetical protein